ncbi:MAG: winged helix-turn-helix domain-containing protein, partial [Pyrinomonadaceae bacterium]
MSSEAQHLYEFGPFCLEASEHRLLRDGRLVPLSPKALETLILLVERNGHVVEKDEMMKTIWPDSFVEEANLTQYIFALRKALGEDDNGKAYIETVFKHGYRFTADVREIGGENSGFEIETRGKTPITIENNESRTRQDGAPRTPITEGWDSHPREAAIWKRRPILIASGALLVGLFLTSFYWWNSRSKTETAVGLRSIAVLPFKSMDSDGDNEHLGMGMTDAFINRLGNIRQIDVRPTRAILKFDREGQDALSAGRELGVDAVLDGSVVRSGDRV